MDEAQEDGDAQLVCSTGDERAFGFAAVRAAEEQRSARRYHERRCERGEERSFRQRRGKQQSGGRKRRIRVAREAEADSLSGTGSYPCGLASTRHARSPVRARGHVRLREFRARRPFLEL